MRTLVKGMFFRGAEVVELVNTLEIDTELRVEHEPENEYDSYACQVFYEDIHIGYVAKEDSMFWAEDAPHTAKITARVDKYIEIESV